MHTLNPMKFTYDPAKSSRNMEERGLSFERALEFDFNSAKYWEDDRQDYSETRYVALGYLDNRLHVLVFQETAEGIRVISLRKANEREGKKHGLPQRRD